MTRLIKHIFTIILFLGIVFMLSTCKKYPENRLWFKKPQNVHPFRGKLTAYNVNGIDSLDLLSSYSKPGLIFNLKEGTFFTYVRYKLDDVSFSVDPQPNGVSIVNYIARIGFKLIDKNSKMKITYQGDTNYYCKNIFISNEQEWQIIKMEKTKGNELGQFKIRTTLNNGNTYEIQLN